MKTFWLSFVLDGSFAGVAIVDAGNLPGACEIAWRLGCNPGGEVHGIALPADVDIPADYKNVLLDRAAAVALRDRLVKPVH